MALRKNQSRLKRGRMSSVIRAALEGTDRPAASPPAAPHAISLHVAVLLSAVAGVVALWNDLTTTWRVVMAVIVATLVVIRLLPLTRWFGTTGTRIDYGGAAIGVLVIPVFALLGHRRRSREPRS